MEVAGGENKSQSVTLLGLAGGMPLVLAAAPGSKATGEAEAEASGRGLVVMITAALAFEWMDLQAKPLMLPLMQELVRQGVGRAARRVRGSGGIDAEAPARSVELRPVSEGKPERHDPRLAGPRRRADAAGRVVACCG